MKQPKAVEFEAAAMSLLQRFRIYCLASAAALWSVVAVSCSSPNPSFCCTSDEDCAAFDVTELRPCSDGLACVANACEVASCASDGCSTNAPVCDIVADTCVGCADSDDCVRFPESGVCDLTSGSCVQCAVESDCGTGRPFCSQQTCVECLISEDCASAQRPICDANACRGCTSDNDCDSQVCDSDAGVCAVAATVLYASSNGSGSSMCTVEAPCSLPRAVALASAQRFTIKLLPGTFTINPDQNGPGLLLPGKKLTLHGFGATLNIAVSGATFQAIDVRPGSDVLVRGLNVQYPNGESTTFDCLGNTVPSRLELDRVQVKARSIIASNTCVVVIRRSTLTEDSTAVIVPPISFANSTVSIDRTLIDGTASFGIRVQTGSQLKLTNSVIVDQSGDAMGAILRSGDSGAVISFTTFFKSHVVCNSQTPTDCSKALCFDNSIFLDGQTVSVSDSVEGAGCTHSHNIAFPQLGSLSGTGNQINVNPKLVAPASGDFKLQSTSPAVDAGDPSTTIEVDFDGNPRPVGSRPDLGAFELQR